MVGQNDVGPLDCLAKCELLIAKLQGELTIKDEQIASLEQMLIETKMELASIKALQDKQSHALYRLKRRISAVSEDDDIDDICGSTHPATTSDKMPSEGDRDDSINKPQRKKGGLEDKHQLILSWSSSNSDLSEVKSWPEQQDNETNIRFEDCEVNRRVSVPNVRGVSHLTNIAKRLSWGNLNTTGPENSSLEGNVQSSGHSKGLRSNTNGMFINMSSRVTADGKSVWLSNNTIDAWADATSDVRQLLSRRQSSSFLDDPQRRSKIGHFLLQLDKGKKTNSGSNATNITEKPTYQHTRKFVSSSRMLDGVLFPVSSNDCLNCLWAE